MGSQKSGQMPSCFVTKKPKYAKPGKPAMVFQLPAPLGYGLTTGCRGLKTIWEVDLPEVYFIYCARFLARSSYQVFRIRKYSVQYYRDDGEKNIKKTEQDKNQTD